MENYQNHNLAVITKNTYSIDTFLTASRTYVKKKSVLPAIEITMFYYSGDMYSRYYSRFFDCLAHPNLGATLATDQK